MTGWPTSTDLRALGDLVEQRLGLQAEIRAAREELHRLNAAQVERRRLLAHIEAQIETVRKAGTHP